MVYTNEQIQSVCDKGSKVLKEFTSIKGCPFPSDIAIQAMTAGLPPEDVGEKIFDSIASTPFSSTGL